VGAVDFGSRDIRVLIAQQEPSGAITVLGHGTAPGRGCVSRGVIQDRNAAQVALKQALSGAEKEARVRAPSLVCGINGRNVETFIREGSAEVPRDVVGLDEMAEARDIASRDILAPGKSITSSVTAQEWFVDGMRVENPLGIRGEVLRTRIHFARIPDVIEENIAACIAAQRRELEDMIFTPLAASLGCLTPEDLELGVAVLDLGHSTTGLAVYRDLCIQGSHCFEWGGYQITRDVAAGLHISFQEADELILEYGISDGHIRRVFGEEPADSSAEEETPRVTLKTAVPGAAGTVDRRDLDEIIFERAHELFVKIRQVLKSRGLTKHLVRGVVLTGGASRIKNAVTLAEGVFQVPCRVGIPGSVEILPPGVNAPEFSAGVGIVRHAFYYRAAARNGQVEARGGAASAARRVSRFFRRYFF
jgi:cell division protein FtsA